MDKDTFDVLLNLLYPYLLRQNRSLCDCIPSEKVPTIGLYHLAQKNTVIKAVHDVTEALFELRNEYIWFPVTEVETIASIETFSELSDLSNVSGAIDGTHIEIEAPLESTVNYFIQ